MIEYNVEVGELTPQWFPPKTMMHACPLPFPLQ